MMDHSLGRNAARAGVRACLEAVEVEFRFSGISVWHIQAEVRIVALSLGERVASGASQVRGYSVMLAHLIPPGRATDPSPVPRRLVKTPVAGHPLPLGEGENPIRVIIAIS